MKRPSETCRNCGGNDFYAQQANFQGHTSMLLRVGFFSAAEATVRVCGDCGLVEWFVNEATLERVKKKFVKGSTLPPPPAPDRSVWG